MMGILCKWGTFLCQRLDGAHPNSRAFWETRDLLGPELLREEKNNEAKKEENKKRKWKLYGEREHRDRRHSWCGDDEGIGREKKGAPCRSRPLAVRSVPRLK